MRDLQALSLTTPFQKFVEAFSKGRVSLVVQHLEDLGRQTFLATTNRLIVSFINARSRFAVT